MVVSLPGTRYGELWVRILLLVLSAGSIHPASMERRSPPESDTSPLPYYEVALDTEGRLRLYWTVDEGAEAVNMEVRVKGGPADGGWVGVGFSDRGEISNADLCVLWVDKKGKSKFQDVWTDEAGFASLDDHDDCPLGSLRRKGSVTRYAWTRKFDTCDSQDYVIEKGTTHVVWAMGEGRVRRLDGLNLAKERHGFQRVQLLKTTPPTPPFPDDASSFVVHHTEVKVPNVETTYWCTLHLLPENFKKKNHVIQYSSEIQKENEGVVHHMEVFHCEVAPEKALPDWSGPCTDPRRPPETEPCKRVLAAWAMGALPFNYPDEAGLPIGGPDFSRYVMLEVHFNNPSLMDGLVDSSGIRLTFTPTLRQFDAGVMELGLEYTDKMAIPPHQPDFTLTAHCVAECTRAGLPADGMVIFGSQLHTHLTGIKVYTRHIRESVELPELNRDNHYSTHFQEIRRLKRKVKVVPGDVLITTCHYATMDRVNITLGGYAISDEMCVNYIHYYPRTNLEVCKSSIDTRVLRSYFDYMHKYHDQPTSKSGSVDSNYKAIHWSQGHSDFLHSLYDQAPLSMQCNQSSGERFPGFWNGVQLPQILYPLPPPKRKCSNDVKQQDKESEADDDAGAV